MSIKNRELKTYEEKLKVANAYLGRYFLDWDDMPDINSLHDAEDVISVVEFCQERLEDSGLSETIISDW